MKINLEDLDIYTLEFIDNVIDSFCYLQEHLSGEGPFFFPNRQDILDLVNKLNGAVDED